MSDITTLMMAASGAGGAETDPNFNQTVLLLHGDGTNGAQNNTFLDSSTNNFTITRNGNTTQGTFSPFSNADGEWSNYFDGSGDYLSAANNAAFQFGTGDFTIEAWIYPTILHNGVISGIGNYTNTSYNMYEFRVLSSGVLNFGYGHVSNWTTLSSSSSVPLNTWTHVAVTRSGTTIRLFINGVQDGSASSSLNFNSIYATYVGANDQGSFGFGNYFNGYISNMRMVKGTAVYTSAFTPPTAPLTAIANTSLLTCQSNRFVDNSSNAFAITIAGNTSVQPFSPFAPSAAYSASVNGGSGYFDGSGDYLSIADAAGLRFGTGNFTIQCWIYRNAAGAVHSIAAKGGASTGWVFQVHSDNKLRFTHTTTNIDSTGTIPASAWTHVAVVREGTGTNQVKLYINGVQDGQGTVSTNFTQTEQLNIGADRGNSNVMNGYIAGFKYVVGTAETITVPTAPPTGGTALLNFTNAGIFDNTGKNNLETVADAQIDTGTKKYGTGSMEFDGTGDYLKLSGQPENFVFGTGDFTIEFWYYPASVSGGETLYEGRPVSTNGVYPTISRVNADMVYTVSDANRITGTSALSATTWQHIAVSRSGTSTKMFVDGTQVGSTYTDTNNYLSATIGPRIGVNAFTGGTINGYIDDLRITKGVARYTTTFTPPTAALPDL